MNSTLTKLDPQEKKFCRLVAKGYPYTTAYRKAFPAKSHLKYDTVRRNAWVLSTRNHIVTEVDKVRTHLSELANKAVNRLDDIIVGGKEHNALDASKFAIEQEFGKARQITDVRAAHVHVTYDLSGGAAPPVPKDVLDQLED